MDLVIRGRQISTLDLNLIRSMIARLNHRGRFFISIELCRLWNWTNNSGQLKDAACRAILLGLEARGLITLPPRRSGGIGQKRRDPSRLFAPPGPSQQKTLYWPRHIEWQLAQHSTVSLYRDLLDKHHYLGYCREVGNSLRYIAYADKEPIALIGWAAAAQKVACRDEFIGWTSEQRLKRLHLVINNTRFLVIPRIRHLASHLLATNVRRLSADWQKRYGYAPVLLETFVDSTRFKGTCYKAANWIDVGLTRGRGKYDRNSRRPETIKAVFLYPLASNFRESLLS